MQGVRFPAGGFPPPPPPPAGLECVGSTTFCNFTGHLPFQTCCLWFLGSGGRHCPMSPPAASPDPVSLPTHISCFRVWVILPSHVAFSIPPTSSCRPCRLAHPHLWCGLSSVVSESLPCFLLSLGESLSSSERLTLLPVGPSNLATLPLPLPTSNTSKPSLPHLCASAHALRDPLGTAAFILYTLGRYYFLEEAFPDPPLTRIPPRKPSPLGKGGTYNLASRPP